MIVLQCAAVCCSVWQCCALQCERDGEIAVSWFCSVTLVAGLFFEADKTREILKQRKFHIAQMQLTSEVLVPVEWIHKSPTVIFCQPIFLPNISTCLFEKKNVKSKALTTI